jgi:hypothetical protein
MAKTLVRRLTKSTKKTLKNFGFSKTYLFKLKELMKIGVSFRKAKMMIDKEDK